MQGQPFDDETDAHVSASVQPPLPPSQGLSADELNRTFLKDLADTLAMPVEDVNLGTKPLLVNTRAPLPPTLRVYLYTLTTHHTERQKGAYKAQIILPPHKRGEFKRLDFTDAFVLLGAYEPNLEAYVFWDALRYDEGRGIAFSRSVQVQDIYIHKALVDGVAVEDRRVRDNYGTEKVVVCDRSHLVDGIAKRFALQIERLTR